MSSTVEHDIEMSSLTFKSLVTGTINPITGILLTNNNAKGPSVPLSANARIGNVTDNANKRIAGRKTTNANRIQPR